MLDSTCSGNHSLMVPKHQVLVFAFVSRRRHIEKYSLSYKVTREHPDVHLDADPDPTNRRVDETDLDSLALEASRHGMTDDKPYGGPDDDIGKEMLVGVES